MRALVICLVLMGCGIKGDPVPVGDAGAPCLFCE